MITAYKKLNVALLYITLVYISEFPFIVWVKLQLVGRDSYASGEPHQYNILYLKLNHLNHLDQYEIQNIADGLVICSSFFEKNFSRKLNSFFLKVCPAANKSSLCHKLHWIYKWAIHNRRPPHLKPNLFSWGVKFHMCNLIPKPLLLYKTSFFKLYIYIYW